MKIRLLTPKETTERLRCSLAYVYALSSKGLLPKYKIGKKLFFREEDLENYIEECRIESNTRYKRVLT